MATARAARRQPPPPGVRSEPREQVVSATAGHEVVEAHRNGVPFLFKRKRTAARPPQPWVGSAQRRSAGTRDVLKTPVAAWPAQPMVSAAARPSPYADEMELPQGLGRRLAEGMHLLPERTAPAGRLLAFCSSLGSATAEAAVVAPSGRATGPVLANAFAEFQRTLAQAMGAIQPPPTRLPTSPAQDGEVDQPQYEIDLQARKAGLRSRLANFVKEEEEWHALLVQMHELDRQELLAPTPGAVPTTPPRELEGNELAALAQLRADLHRHLTVQVEGVCKVVGDVEELVERANCDAQAAQAKYHAEKFCVFRHVDSPARLIKELVRPGAKAPHSWLQHVAADLEQAAVEAA